ncbi:MAG: hypothetical protein M3347_13770, partial [Armatimonadota bacterium]|nr:hypothetical protein [Armatimonadota bacterium]
GKTTTFTLDLAPPAGGWKNDGRLRLQTLQPMGDSRFVVKLNDAVLTPTDDISEPYPHANPTLLGTPETLRAWLVPATLLGDGPNQLRVTLEAGASVQIAFLDMAVR